MILVTYKNTKEIFSEKNLDCSEWTEKGHAANLIEKWSKGIKGVHLIDRYNAVLLDDIINVQVI